MTYFFFGLLSILAFLLSSSKSVPVIYAEAIWNTVRDVLYWVFVWALVPIGGLAILWASVLFTVAFNWKLAEQLEKSRLRRIRRWNRLFYWPALVTVFGNSFKSIWVSMVSAGASEPFLFVVYGLGIIVLLGLLVHHIRGGRQ